MIGLQYLQNTKVRDIWFLLEISAIGVQLRLPVIANFERQILLPINYRRLKDDFLVIN